MLQLLLLEWARQHSCCPGRQDIISDFRNHFEKKESITEYCLYGKKQSHCQNEEKQPVSAKMLNTDCYLVCVFERDFIPLFFVSDVWGMVFNGMGQTGSSWNMDLIPYLYKQKHISCCELCMMRGKKWGQEFKHYTLFTKRGKENVHKGDTSCRHFCLCLGTNVYLHYYTLLIAYAHHTETAQKGLSTELTVSPWM